MKNKKRIYIVGITFILQILISFKDRQILKKLEEEFGRLFCYNILVEEKIIMILMIGLAFLLAKNRKIILFFRYFIIGIIVLQIIDKIPYLGYLVQIIDNSLMLISSISFFYIFYILIIKALNFKKRKI